MVIQSLQQALLVARAQPHIAPLVGADEAELQLWAKAHLGWLEHVPVLADREHRGPFVVGFDSTGSRVGVLDTNRICLPRVPVPKRLARVLHGHLRPDGSVPEEFDQAKLAAIEPVSWAKAVRDHRRPPAWLQADYVVLEGAHRVTAQVLLGIPVHGRISPSPVTFR